MQIKTHKSINQTLSGEPIRIEEGKNGALKLKTSKDMKADEKALFMEVLFSLLQIILL